MTIPVSLRAPLLSALSLVLAGSLAAQSALPRPASRIAPGTDLGPATRLTGNLPRWVTPAAEVGTVLDATPLRITVVLSRSAEMEAAFTQLVNDQQNPSSPRYHQWLTPAQIGEQFGPSMEDVNAVTGWLTRQGLEVVSVAPSRVFIEVSGTTGTIGAAFGTSFHHYTLEGQARLAASTEPSLPSALTVVVSGIDGLAEIPLRPYHALAPAQPRTAGDAAHPMYSNSTNTTHYMFPGDFAKIYDVTTSSGGVYAGTGVKVAIIGRSRITATDITELEGLAGLPAKTQNTILVPTSTDPGLVTGDEDESTLDVGRVLTVAPGAQADLVIAAQASGGINAAMQYNINTLVDPVMTISYGACEALAGAVNVNSIDMLFKTAAAEGISTFVSSGDSAASGCTASGSTPKGTETVGINYICASSYATCVGGTEFNDTAAPSLYWAATNSSTYVSALGYIPEGAWNEPTYQQTVSGVTSTAYQVLGTGGGPSVNIAKPSFQTALTSADGARDTPDISFSSAGHDPYFACLAYKGSAYDCSSGGGTLFYGTSAAAPDMAAVAAIVVQKAGKSQGNMNPAIYALAASTPSVFHDATPASSGVSSCTVTVASMCNNSVPGPSSLTGLSGYPLQVGYDLATGLGSIDITNFVNAITAIPALPSSTTTVTANPTAIAAGKTAVFTATVAVASSSAATGTVQFYSNGTALGSPVTLSGGSASTPASTFTTAGTYAITAAYSGDTNNAASTSTALSFVVSALPSTTTALTAAPTTILAGKTAIFTATVSITSSTAATGTVQFYSNGTALGSAVTLAGGAAMSSSTAFPTAGTYTITATYSGDSNNAPSTGTLSYVVSPLPATTTTVTAAPSTVIVNNSTTFTATLTGSGAATATGTVQFLMNGSALGSAVTISNGKASLVSQPFGAAGTYTITANYSGDSNNAASSGSLSFVVSPLPATTTTVTAAPSTVVAGGSAVFTATLSGSGSFTPTGTVQFLSNGVAFGSAVTVSGGKATSISQQFTTVGSYTITATYSGDSNNAASNSSALTFPVTAATPVGLAVSSTPATLTLTAGATTGNTTNISVATTAGYYGNIALACTITYSGGTTAVYPPTCTFTPVSLSFTGGTSSTSVMTLTTTLPHAISGPAKAARNTNPFAPLGGIGFAALLLVLIPSKRRRKMGLLAILPLVLLAAGMISMIGCGGSGSTTTPATPVGTSKGNYSVVVSATPSAGTLASTTVTLTVQ